MLPRAPQPTAAGHASGANNQLALQVARRNRTAPLSTAVRSRFEPLFGQSFADVRVRTGPGVASELRAAGASARTQDRTISLGASAGLRIVAHELAHVVQQRRHDPAGPPASSLHEHEADHAALCALAGRNVGPLSPVAARSTQNAPPDPAATEDLLAVLAGANASLAEQYPELITRLPADDFAALEAASETRYATRKDPKAAPTSEIEAAAAIARTEVSVPLDALLVDTARFVDHDIWESLFGVLKAEGSEDLASGFLRNEMMRRWAADKGIDPAKDLVTIRLRDADGKTKGSSRLSFELRGKSITTTGGAIAGPDLETAFGPMESFIRQVSAEGDKVALGAAIVSELDKLEPLIQSAAGVHQSPKDHSRNESQNLAARAAAAQPFVDDFVKRKGPVPAGASDVQARLKKLRETIDAAAKFAAQWHAANPAGESLGMMNDRWGTSAAGYGMQHWEQGNYGRGALGYTGATGVALLEGVEKLLSFGFHDTATLVAQAYARGDISWNEGEDLIHSAAGKALLAALLTRGIGAGASRLGTAAAGGFGLGARTTAFGLTSGGISGALSGAGATAAQSLLSAPFSFKSTAAQDIWDQSKPKGIDYLMATAGGGLFGSLGGARLVQLKNQKDLGTIIELDGRKLRLDAITKQGDEVWSTVKVPTPAANAAPPKVVLVVQPDGSVVVETGKPSAAMVVSRPTAMVPATPPANPNAFAFSYLEALKKGSTLSATALSSSYQAAKAPMLPAADQPIGLLMPPSPLEADVWARAIPGTPGFVTGGDSDLLGKNLFQSFGLKRSTPRSGWQAHHIIPDDMASHPVLEKIGMDLDHPTNGMMLPEPRTAKELGIKLPTHKGYHSTYSDAILAELDAMDINLPVRVLELKVFGLQQRARAALLQGRPMYPSKGATPELWKEWLTP